MDITPNTINIVIRCGEIYPIVGDSPPTISIGVSVTAPTVTFTGVHLYPDNITIAIALSSVGQPLTESVGLIDVDIAVATLNKSQTYAGEDLEVTESIALTNVATNYKVVLAALLSSFGLSADKEITGNTHVSDSLHSISNDLIFAGDLSTHDVYTVTTQVILDHSVGTEVQGNTDETLVFGSSVEVADGVDHIIVFTGDVDVVSGWALDHDITFSQEISFGTDVSTTLTEAISFSQVVHTLESTVVSLPSRSVRTPANTFIIAIPSYGNITLPSPIFGDQFAVEYRQAKNRNYAGRVMLGPTLNALHTEDTEAFRTITRIFTFEGVDTETLNSFRSGVIDQMGKKFNITDHNSQEWEAILLNPDFSSRATYKDSCSKEYHTFELEFLVTERP